MFGATQKLSCKASCKTPLFLIVNIHSYHWCNCKKTLIKLETLTWVSITSFDTQFPKILNILSLRPKWFKYLVPQKYPRSTSNLGNVVAPLISLG